MSIASITTTMSVTCTNAYAHYCSENGDKCTCTHISRERDGVTATLWKLFGFPGRDGEILEPDKKRKEGALP